jgi:hypothetical protein
MKGMGDPNVLFLGVVFGSIGMGYLVFGKKQQRIMAFVSGVALCLLPYVVSGAFGIIALGLVFVVLPFLVKV